MSVVATSAVLPAWIGTPPKDWSADWLKWHVRLSTARPSDDEAEQLPYISNEDIESWTGRMLNSDPQPVEADGRRFWTDDVLFNKLRPYLAKVHHASFDGVSSGELLCLRPSDEVLPRFLFYVACSKAFVDAVNAETFGSKMPRADWEIVGHQPLPLPPFETQKRIAAFLDGKTAQIDALIARKQALQNRLAEKRLAIITQAVTKGLDPATPMKDSGIDWFGQIPAHWEIKPLKRAIFYQEGPGIMAADFRDEGVPLLRVASVGERWSTLAGANFLEPEMVAKKWSHFLTKQGDLLISASATSGIISEVGIDTVNCIPYTGIIRLNAIEEVSVTSFIRHFAVSQPFIAQIDQLKAGSTIQHFGPYHLGLMSLALPPVEEQLQIADFLDVVLERCSHVEGEIKRSLAQLSEYRAALITSAVTGQMEI